MYLRLSLPTPYGKTIKYIKETKMPLLWWMKSVSYTHLDVYKRQQPNMTDTFTNFAGI